MVDKVVNIWYYKYIKKKEELSMENVQSKNTNGLDCPRPVDNFIHFTTFFVSEGGWLVFLFKIKFLTKKWGDTPSSLLSQGFWELCCTQPIYF